MLRHWSASVVASTVSGPPLQGNEGARQRPEQSPARGNDCVTRARHPLGLGPWASNALDRTTGRGRDVVSSAAGPLREGTRAPWDSPSGNGAHRVGSRLDADALTAEGGQILLLSNGIQASGLGALLDGRAAWGDLCEGGDERSLRSQTWRPDPSRDSPTRLCPAEVCGYAEPLGPVSRLSWAGRGAVVTA